MKLLHVVRSLDPRGGGVAEGLVNLSLHLRSLGVQSTLLSLDPPQSPWLDARYMHGIGPVHGVYGFGRSIKSQIAHYSRSHDLVVINGIWQYHSLATWRALRATGKPYLVYPHGMLDPWFKSTYPIKHLKKSIYWPLADYWVLREAKAVLFTTDQERLLARRTFKLYQANEVVVGYGTSAPPKDVERQRTAFFNRFPQLRGKRIFLFLSRIHPKKGVDLLLEAFATIAAIDQSLWLVIAGPDQVGFKADLQKRAAELGIADRVTWAGMLTGDLKYGAFRCAELFCLPSHQENFGIVVAESLSCSLPVAIAEPVNISVEVLAAGAGIVHPDTAAGTTAALRHWLAMTPPARAEMGVRGWHLFAERFDFASVARNLIPVLQDAVRSHSSR